MSRFNAFLAIFAILMVMYLIVDGPPETGLSSDDTTENTSPYEPLGLYSSDILSLEIRRQDGERVSISRQSDSSWQNQITGDILTDSDLPEALAAIVGFTPYRQLTRFNSSEDLVQYGLSNNPLYIISFETAVLSEDNSIMSFSFYIGGATPSTEEFYILFVDRNTNIPPAQGEIYVIPRQHVLTLDATFAELLQQEQGQTPDS